MFNGNFMKIKTLHINGLIFIITGLMLLPGMQACQKDDTEDFVDDAKIVAECIRTEDYMTDLFGLLHSSIFDTTLTNHDTAFVENIFVTRQFDTITGRTTFTYDFESPMQPDVVRQVYGGKVTATLFEPFENPDALMQASFFEYTVHDYLLQGYIKYRNTGEVVNGQKKYTLVYSADLIWNEKKLLTFIPFRTLYWTSGFDTPDDVQDDEFIFPEGIETDYFIPDNGQQETVVTIEFTENWSLGISCFRYYQNGKFDAFMERNEQPVELNGDFIDADLDNCADKVMIKNSDNSLGYPYYL